MNKHTDIKVFKRILCNTNIGLMTNNSPNITDKTKSPNITDKTKSPNITDKTKSPNITDYFKVDKKPDISITTDNEIKTDNLKNEEFKITPKQQQKLDKAKRLAEKMGMVVLSSFNTRREIVDNYYGVSQMVNDSGSRIFFFHKNINVINTFIKRLPNHYLFEVIHTNFPKPYFDIDKINITEKEYSTLLDIIVNEFNKDFNTKVIQDNVIGLVKKKEDGNIISTHINFTKHSIDKKILKYWVEEFNKKELISHVLDTAVYSNNQSFCLKDNCKMGKEEVFKLWKDKQFTDDDYLMMTGYSYNKCIVEHRPYNESIEMKESMRKHNKIPRLTLKDDNIIKVNKYNLVENLLNTLKPNGKFYTSRFWSGFVKTMKYALIDDVERFVDSSVGRASSDIYNIQQNRKWYDDITLTNVEYKSIENQLHKLNNEFDCRFVWGGIKFYDTAELREWCMKHTGLEIETVNEKFNKIHQKCYDKPTKITFTPTIYLDITRMFLIDTTPKSPSINDKTPKSPSINDNTTEEVKCYWGYYHNNVVGLKESLDNDNGNGKFSVQPIEELQKRIIKFKTNTTKLFGIRMAWGMGKSYRIMKPFINKIIDDKTDDFKNILVLTESNSLNKEVVSDFKEIYDNELIWGHTESVKLNTKHRIFVCSLESLSKLKDVKFDVIILDEFESIISHLESTTFNQYSASDVLKDIKHHIINCKKLLILDADVSYRRLDIIRVECNIKNDFMELYENKDNKWRTHKFNIHVGDRMGTISGIIDDINNNKNVSIAVMSKRDAESLFEIISNKCINANILGVWKDTKQYRLKGEDVRRLDQKEAKCNMNDMIDSKSINVWIYSPTILTGISYNKPNWFNRTYLLTTEKSCVARLGIQMIFRVRELIDKEIHICFKKLNRPIDSPTDKEMVEIITSKKIISNGMDVSALFGEKVDILEVFKNIKVENLKELYLSNIDNGGDLGQEILRILTVNHQIPVSFVDISKDQYDDMIKRVDWIDVKNVVNDKNIEIMRDVEYKNQRQSNHIEQKNFIDSNDFKSIMEVRKKQLLTHLGLRRSYYKQYHSKTFNDVRIIHTQDKTEVIGVVNEKTNMYYMNYTPTTNEYSVGGVFKMSVDEYKTFVTKNGKMDKTLITDNIATKIENGLYNIVNPTDCINHIGSESVSYGNGEIKTTSLTYENQIHNTKTIWKVLLDQDKINHISNINDFNYSHIRNCNGIITTDTLDKRDDDNIFNNNLKWIIYKIIPELFIKLDDNEKEVGEDSETIEWNKTNELLNKYKIILRLRNLNITVKDFNTRLQDNKFEIENYWKKLMELNSIKKSDILLKVKNDKTQDKIIYYLKSLLKQIGVDIQSPQNKKRDNDLYKITYDNKHIYQDVVQKPKTRDIRIKNDILSVNGLEYKLLNNRNKIITDVVSKSNTIKASIKKIINIDGKNDINSYNIVNWKRDDDNGEWRKDTNSIVWKSTSINVIKFKVKNDDIKWEDVVKNIDIFREHYVEFFIRMRASTENMEISKYRYNELKNIYYKNRHINHTTLCLIENENDNENDGGIGKSDVVIDKALDEGISN